MEIGLCHGNWTFLAIFQLDDSGRMGELGQEFRRIRYRNFDEPGVRSIRTSYGIWEKSCMGFGTACMYVLRIRLTGVHVCFTELAESIIATGVATSTI